MKVWVNGEPVELAAGASVADLVGARGYDPTRPGAAVAVNGEVVPRGEWSRRELVEDDHVDVLGAVQGG